MHGTKFENFKFKLFLRKFKGFFFKKRPQKRLKRLKNGFYLWNNMPKLFLPAVIMFSIANYKLIIKA